MEIILYVKNLYQVFLRIAGYSKNNSVQAIIRLYFSYMLITILAEILVN
jgi:hypothetical protein